VIDDDGHTLERGQRMAVCDKTFRLYQREPYRDQFYFVEPLTPMNPEEAVSFDCRRNAVRNPKETKGQDYDATTDASACCGPDGCC
jgi:arsenite methyltransferase